MNTFLLFLFGVVVFGICLYFIMCYRNGELFTMGKEDGVGAFLLGLVLGGLGVLLLALTFKPKCPNPNCKSVVKKGTPTCPKCGAKLLW
jgi:ABC-type transport system involved in multi-copper enzyme maturation permease subunit